MWWPCQRGEMGLVTYPCRFGAKSFQPNMTRVIWVYDATFGAIEKIMSCTRFPTILTSTYIAYIHINTYTYAQASLHAGKLTHHGWRDSSEINPTRWGLIHFSWTTLLQYQFWNQIIYICYRINPLCCVPSQRIHINTM